MFPYEEGTWRTERICKACTLVEDPNPTWSWVNLDWTILCQLESKCLQAESDGVRAISELEH